MARSSGERRHAAPRGEAPAPTALAPAADASLLRVWLAALEAYETAFLARGDMPREQRVSTAMVEAIDRCQELPEDLLAITLVAFERARGEA